MLRGVHCQTEGEFRKWFEEHLQEVGVKRVILSQRACPDYVVEMANGTVAKVEAELFAENFALHKHDPAKADFILACYSKNERVSGVRVVAINRLWLHEPEPLLPLRPDEPLSPEEGRLLSAIHSSGGIEMSALSEGLLRGTAALFIRLPPETVKRLRWRRLGDSLMNVITDRTKLYINKYHHALIGVGLSEKACELIESLTRRGLVESRPICILAALQDGALIDHDGWIPTELHATPLAWKYHKETILNYLNG